MEEVSKNLLLHNVCLDHRSQWSGTAFVYPGLNLDSQIRNSKWKTEMVIVSKIAELYLLSSVWVCLFKCPHGYTLYIFRLNRNGTGHHPPLNLCEIEPVYARFVIKSRFLFAPLGDSCNGNIACRFIILYGDSTTPPYTYNTVMESTGRVIINRDRY